jgi:CotS family spore coat protein
MAVAKNDPPDSPDDLITSVAGGFGLDLLKSVSYRGVWRLETSAGFKYLKRSKLSTVELQFIYEALEYLTAQTFTRVPRLALSKSGEPFWVHQGKIYILTDWYFSRELDFNLMMDLKQAARFLAEFHLIGTGFTPSREETTRTCWFNWPAKLETRLRQLQNFRKIALAEKETSSFSRLYLRNFEPHYRQAMLSFEALLDSPYYQVAAAESKVKSFCHHDFSSRNLLRTFDNQLLLVDFDYCLRDIRIHDIINLLVRNLKHQEWSHEICRFILREYHQVTRLTPEEMEVMYILLSWPQDFWQVGLQYYDEKLPWPYERFFKKLQSKINSRPARDNFLREFPLQNGIYTWNT